MNSTTSSYLISQATENIWCAPFQDCQMILDLTRITRDGGAKISEVIMWRDTPLPTSTDTYHLYQIGANSRWRTGLPDQRGIWYPLASWAQDNFLIMNLYLSTGVSVPLFSSYVIRTYDDALVIAVKTYPSLFDLDNNPLFFRVYNNAFFNSVRSNAIKIKVAYGGGTVTSTTDATTWRAEFKKFLTLAGNTNVWYNGVWVTDFAPSKAAVGDVIEYCYDSAVSHVIDFKVSNLMDYTSALDNLKKYLLHPAKSTHEAEIFYVDDIDVYLYQVNSAGNALEGRYFNRNKANSLRNITHADYSIPIGYITSYINDGWTSQDNVYIRLHLRQSGYDRPLINEINRINILYNLTDDEILAAMLGNNATVDEWLVNNLEQSVYTAIMRNDFATFTADDVVNAYGYNSLSQIFAQSPTVVSTEGTDLYVDVAFGLIQGSCCYEYSAEGLLLGATNHAYSERYFAQQSAAGIIEAVMGWGTKEIPWSPSNDSVALGSDWPYFFYTCPVNNGVLTGDWVPAVEGTDYTIDASNNLTWIHVTARNMGLVLSAQYHLLYNETLSTSDGIYRFTLMYSATKGTLLPIMPLQLDIFMNGHPCVEGVDYVMNGNVGTFLSNRYVISGQDPIIVVRGLGWETPTEKRRQPRNVGFTDHGYLSKNGVYDLRQDKVTRVVVDGYLKIPSEMPWIENASTSTIAPLANGLLYAEQIMYTPLWGIDTDTNESLYTAAVASDSRISDYMTLKNPEITFTTPNAITERYRVFSPTITRLYFEITQNLITIPVNANDYTALDNLMKNYSSYLDIDPCRDTLNSNYLQIDAHPFTNALAITTATWNFLNNVNTRYLSGKLSISNFFFIKD